MVGFGLSKRTLALGRLLMSNYEPTFLYRYKAEYANRPDWIGFGEWREKKSTVKGEITRAKRYGGATTYTIQQTVLAPPVDVEEYG